LTLPVLALAGPTASGKSAAALAVARALRPQQRVEIISVDSALVYRGMNIGTAKPSAAEQAEVPHHLIDLIDPAQAYSAARFVADAKAVMADIRSRAARNGWPALHAELARVDPVTAARLAPLDAQRIQRALEVWQLTGQPLSQWHAGAASAPASDGALQALPGVELQLIALEPASRAWLHERIAQRFDAMLAAGFLQELQSLRQRADLHPELPSMRCVGYRQAWQALNHDGSLAPGSPTWDAFREAGIAATRQLAKRQLTWLRSMPQRHIVACDAPDAVARVTDRIQSLLER
jgi:tRNA dimethylallyltransferase